MGTLPHEAANGGPTEPARILGNADMFAVSMTEERLQLEQIPRRSLAAGGDHYMIHARRQVRCLQGNAMAPAALPRCSSLSRKLAAQCIEETHGHRRGRCNIEANDGLISAGIGCKIRMNSAGP